MTRYWAWGFGGGRKMGSLARVWVTLEVEVWGMGERNIQIRTSELEM